MNTTSQSPLAQAWARLSKNKAALVALGVLVTMVLACVAGPWVSPFSFDGQNLTLGATPPSREHWFGTDLLGRDLLTRTLYGGRISLMVGIVATLVSLGIGVVYGTVSGYLGGLTDRVLMRLVDIVYALPFTIFVILLMVVFGRSMFLLFAAIGMVEWLNMARIVRGQVQMLRQQTYVQAAQCMGQSTPMIMCRHLLPNMAGIIIVYTTLTVPNVMLLEAFISFLGLGVQAPHTSWGDLIQTGASSMEEQPWQLVFPSLCFAATLLSLNFLGDGLRDALDPRSEK